MHNLKSSTELKLRTTSSIISLIAAQQRIIDRGTAVVYRPVGDTPGICCRTAMQRKKIFEYFRNCSKRNFGRNDRIEYLLVLI